MLRPRFALALLAGIAEASPGTSPGNVTVEGTYTSGQFDTSEELHTYGLRVDAEYAVREPVLVSASAGVMHVRSVEEAELATATAATNPSLLVHYRVRRGAWELRAKTGFVLSSGFEPALLVGGAFEAPRRPYDFATKSGVPLVAMARTRIATWDVEAEGGVYVVSDGGPQADVVHLSVAASHRADNLGFVARLHALFVPVASRVPAYQANANRAYYGAELGVEYVIGPDLVRLSLYKPFGYDNADVANGGTAFCLASAVAF